MSFEYTLDPSFTSDDYILFAYAHPFTKTDVDASIDAFELKCKSNPSVYFHREVLTRSLEGHSMHFMTVTWDETDNESLQRIHDLQSSITQTKPSLKSVKSKAKSSLKNAKSSLSKEIKSLDSKEELKLDDCQEKAKPSKQQPLVLPEVLGDVRDFIVDE